MKLLSPPAKVLRQIFTVVIVAAFAVCLMIFAWRTSVTFFEFKNPVQAANMGVASAPYSDALGPWPQGSMSYYLHGVPATQLYRPTIGLFFGTIISATQSIAAVPIFWKPQTLIAATALTADDFCVAREVTRLDFVKLDVDGHELSVLKGFRDSLARFRPAILIQIAPFVYKGANADEFEEFINFLAGLNYDFTDANTGRPISSDPAELRRIITPGACINAILLPRPE